MTTEPEAEVSDVALAMAADPAHAETLLEVTYQRNPRQKYKYLEAEPKILGVTEIALAVFFIGLRVTYIVIPVELYPNIIVLAVSFVGIIAGSVAIAAQNLTLQTLKACLGMQVVTCVTFAFCFLYTTSTSESLRHVCWFYRGHSQEMYENGTCLLLEEGYGHITSLDQLLEVTQIAISVTLAAFCCKVIPCCAPRSHVPVIVLRPPTAPQ